MTAFLALAVALLGAGCDSNGSEDTLTASPSTTTSAISATGSAPTPSGTTTGTGGTTLPATTTGTGGTTLPGTTTGTGGTTLPATTTGTGGTTLPSTTAGTSTTTVPSTATGSGTTTGVTTTTAGTPTTTGVTTTGAPTSTPSTTSTSTTTCGPDADGDGVGDLCDPCPVDLYDDSDGDGSCDSFDLCVGDDSLGDANGNSICDDECVEIVGDWEPAFQGSYQGTPWCVQVLADGTFCLATDYSPAPTYAGTCTYGDITSGSEALYYQPATDQLMHDFNLYDRAAVGYCGSYCY